MLGEGEQAQIEAVAERLRESGDLLFITGAGLSADSGLPTYRGIGGLYNGERTEEGISIEQALSGMMLRERPEVAWRYIGRIEAACRGARPNRGHEVIAEMGGRFARVVVLTQNIDGFHREAGSKEVIDIHGDFHDLYCENSSCGYRETVGDYGGLALPPRCPRCGAGVRPDVVFFGEALPTAKVERLLTEVERGFEVIFSVGTTSVFPYIAHPVWEARRRGITTVEINPGQTQVSELVDYKIAAGAAESLEAIWAKVKGKMD